MKEYLHIISFICIFKNRYNYIKICFEKSYESGLCGADFKGFVYQYFVDKQIYINNLMDYCVEKSAVITYFQNIF